MKLSGFASTVALASAVGFVLLAETDPRGLLVGAVDVLSRVGFWGLLFVATARLAARALGSRLTGLAHIAWDGACGLALLMPLLVIVGLVPGGFQAATVRTAVAIVIVAGVAAAWSDTTARFRSSHPASVSDRGVALLLLAVTIVGLAWDRVPPLFYDARAYHFAFPELWLDTGRVTPVTWSVLSWFPPGMSMLYGVGLATGGEPWANDANLLIGLCLIAMAADLSRRMIGPGSGFLAAVLTVSTPLVLYALAIPGADLAHGLFVLGAIACLLDRSIERRSWLKRAAILTAGAVLTKYLGVIIPLGLGIAWLILKPSEVDGDRSVVSRFGRAVRFAAPAFVLGLPWFAANMVVVGNPVAPVASTVIATRGLAPGWAESFRADTRGGFPHVDDFSQLGPRWLTGSEEESRIYPTPAWGWLPAVLVAVALVAARKERAVLAMLGLAAIIIAIWWLTFRWERFLVAPAALIAVASAGGILAVQRRNPKLRVLTIIAIGAAAGSVLFSSARIVRFSNGVRVALGRETATEFVDGALAMVRLFDRERALFAAGQDQVLLVGEIRHYGLGVRRCAPTGFNTHPLVEALRADAAPEIVNRSLRKQGFTHIVVDPGWVARSAAKYPSLAYFSDHPQALRSYLSTLGSPIAVEGQVALFKIPE